VPCVSPFWWRTLLNNCEEIMKPENFFGVFKKRREKNAQKEQESV
jgi:hypothetical protein